MKPQPRGTGCVNCARPDQWGGVVRPAGRAALSRKQQQKIVDVCLTFFYQTPMETLKVIVVCVGFLVTLMTWIYFGLKGGKVYAIQQWLGLYSKDVSPRVYSLLISQNPLVRFLGLVATGIAPSFIVGLLFLVILLLTEGS